MEGRPDFGGREPSGEAGGSEKKKEKGCPAGQVLCTGADPACLVQPLEDERTPMHLLSAQGHDPAPAPAKSWLYKNA